MGLIETTIMVAAAAITAWPAVYVTWLILRWTFKVLVMGFLKQVPEKLANDLRAIAQSLMAGSMVPIILGALQMRSGKTSDAVLSFLSFPIILLAGLVVHAFARFVENRS